jgi:hypothetical protein
VRKLAVLAAVFLAALSVHALWSMAAYGYEGATLGSFTADAGADAGSPPCVVLPTNLPASAALVLQCRLAPCHYRALGANSDAGVTQHDSYIAQDTPILVPIDSSVGKVCFVGDANAKVTGDVWQQLGSNRRY